MSKSHGKITEEYLRRLGIVSVAPKDHPVYKSGPLVNFVPPAVPKSKKTDGAEPPESPAPAPNPSPEETVSNQATSELGTEAP